MTTTAEPLPDPWEIGVIPGHTRRWRSATPIQPGPRSIYAYVTIGRLNDQRWFTLLQTTGNECFAHGTKHDAETHAATWMTDEWVRLA